MTGQCPSLRPIPPAINTPSYKAANFLVLLLTLLTLSVYTIKDLFSFVEEVPSFDCAHYMTSFDKESVFTNIPLEETINICVDKLFEIKTKYNNLTKISFRSLLELAILDYFRFWWKILQTEKWCSNGFSMGSALANVYVILKNNGCLILFLITNLYII